ncbi:hypothetical protein BaRGS_00024767 [Batillaria attramentaria]|uniref:G-protein coupled receptors family 1 profile domain-containing protein n=1 Tax=Batillaria attramentaria TaxID=370345 RepID=A0ABD0KAF1_9CAEN
MRLPMNDSDVIPTVESNNNTADDSFGYLFTTLNGHHVTAQNLVFYLLQVFVACLVLTLNGLVLDTMVRQGKWREPADLLVAGLALTDALLGVFVLWQTIYTLVYFQSVWECLVRLGLAHSMMLTGMLHLVSLTTDRFLKVVTPYRYKDFCRKWTVWVVMAAIWLLGIVLGSLPVFGWNRSVEAALSGDPVCSYFNIMHEHFLRFYIVLIQFCVVVMATLYLKLFLVARKHAVAIAASVPGESTRQRTSEHAWRYTKTVLLIVGVNYLSWVPMGMVVIASLTGILGDMSIVKKGDLMLYTSCLVYGNSIINPAIYAIKIPAIHARYRALCCRCKKHSSATDGGSRAATTAVFSLHTM